MKQNDLGCLTETDQPCCVKNDWVFFLVVMVYFAECRQCLIVCGRIHENNLIDEKSSQNIGRKRRQFISQGCGTQHQNISARYNITRGPDFDIRSRAIPPDTNDITTHLFAALLLPFFSTGRIQATPSRKEDVALLVYCREVGVSLSSVYPRCI